MTISWRASRVVGIAVVLIASFWILSPKLRRDEPLRTRLLSATGPLFPGGARCADTVPFSPPRRSESTPTRLGALRQEALRILSKRRTPEALRDAALAEMAASRPADAIRFLEEVVTAHPSDSQAWADLSAAYLARGASTAPPRVHDFVLSLSASSRALAQEGSLTAARFNKSAALEQLGLRHETRKSWQKYLALETDPGWRAEAERRLRRLDPSGERENEERLTLALETAALDGDSATVRLIAAGHPDLARLHAEERLFGQWARHASKGQTAEAARALQIAEAIGAALSSANGEHMVLDSVQAIQQAGREGSGRLAGLVAGHELYDQALALRQSDALAQALPIFRRAQARLAAAGSPFARWAALQSAICAYYGGDHPGALAELARIENEPSNGRYPCLRGRICWIRGLVHLAQGHLPEALESYREAVRLFSAAHEEAHAAFVSSSMAATLFNMGESQAAWPYRYRALASLPAIRDPRRVYSVLWEVAKAVLAEEDPEAALPFLDELLAQDGGERVPSAWIEALLRRARVHVRMNGTAEALKDLEQARSLLPRVQDPNLQRRLQFDLQVSEGLAKLDSHPRQALATLNAAYDYYQDQGLRIEAAALRRQRARAYRRTGRVDLAEKELAEGFAEYERYRLELPTDEQKIAYFEQAQDLADERILLLLDLHRPAEALMAGERTRSRALLDFWSQAGGEPAAPLSPAAIQRLLPAGTAILEFAVLENRLAAWLIQESGIQYSEQPVGSAELTRAVNRFNDEIESRELAPRERTAAIHLHDLLIGPFRSRLTPGVRLVIVPDRPLQGAPFAALVDGRTARFLIEDHALAVSPGATLYVTALERSRALAGQRDDVLVVVNDVFDRGLFPTLLPLAGAGMEGERIRSLYPGAVSLRGAAATRRSFLELAPRHGIVHIAGHAVANPRSPSSSALLMAPEGQDGGVLSLRDLSGLRLPRTSLVVLSACSTAAGGPVTREGTLGLARPFLAAGVPGVIASLWDAEDGAAADLFTAFYRHLSNGSDAVEALALAQRDLLRHEEPRQRPDLWAGFQLIGGAAQRTRRISRETP